MLADVTKQARLCAATVLLAEKHDLPLPVKLQRIVSDPHGEPDDDEEVELLEVELTGSND